MKYLLCWTWGMTKPVKTKKRGTELMNVWKRWYERCGWTVVRSRAGGYLAFPPGQGPDDLPTTHHMLGKVHAIGLRDNPVVELRP